MKAMITSTKRILQGLIHPRTFFSRHGEPAFYRSSLFGVFGLGLLSLLTGILLILLYGAKLEEGLVQARVRSGLSASGGSIFASLLVVPTWCALLLCAGHVRHGWLRILGQPGARLWRTQTISLVGGVPVIVFLFLASVLSLVGVGQLPAPVALVLVAAACAWQGCMEYAGLRLVYAQPRGLALLSLFAPVLAGFTALFIWSLGAILLAL